MVYSTLCGVLINKPFDNTWSARVLYNPQPLLKLMN